MAIFPAENLRAFATEVTPWETLDHKLDLLRMLCNRHQEGWLDSVNESSVEQSFNERLFAEVFDYRTLFRDGFSHYELRPKNYHSSGRYDDFALGYFRLNGGTIEVLAELKSPSTDLDRPQTSGRYQGRTPVEQAFAAAEGNESVHWLIISNFDELRLYHVDNQHDYEPLLLSTVVTPADFMRAYALFGKPNLIGDGSGLHSRLAKLLSGGPPIVLDSKEGCVRLIQEARVTTPTKLRVPLSRIYDKLQENFSPFQDPKSWSQQLQILDDRLVLTQGMQPDGSATSHRVEITLNGIIHSNQLMPLANAFNEAEHLQKHFDIVELGNSVHTFIRFSTELLHSLGAQKLSMDFRLVDLQSARVLGVDLPSTAAATTEHSQAWLDLDITVRREEQLVELWKARTTEAVSEIIFRFGAADRFGKWLPARLL